MPKSLLTRILIALFALSLMSGMALAQDKAAKKPAKAAAAAADLLDINSATQGRLDGSAGHRRGLFAEDHRWTSVCRKKVLPQATYN